MANLLTDYEPLDIIGNGSFGVIRKVRRKTDGKLFARKELNFERMTERDKSQIVAEVNILKELKHEHIVRYVDRYVDRKNGILYILMEYCGGGDLAGIIKNARRNSKPLPEDEIWRVFMQLLLALYHCHFPNSVLNVDDPSARPVEITGRPEKPQILHRDLKPENVFLSSENNIKLGDFGLSKQLEKASFASTYVGTPYYMSPELMNEKAYDSKSDIWSLGCLLYELCALNPPFHEAQTHSELSLCIRGGRIPPLPKGYSPALTSVIKSMLNLNPAMRPSAHQLFQHERVRFSWKIGETQKIFTQLNVQREAIAAKEREQALRDTARETEFEAERVRLGEVALELTRQREHFEKEVGLAREAYQAFHAEKEALQLEKEQLLHEKEVLRLEKQKWEEEVLSRMTKKPLDDVKNTIPMPNYSSRYCDETPTKSTGGKFDGALPAPIPSAPFYPRQQTPNRLVPSKSMTNLGSAMKGIILTTTNIALDTPLKIEPEHDYNQPGPSRRATADDTNVNQFQSRLAAAADYASGPDYDHAQSSQLQAHQPPRPIRRSTVSSTSRPIFPSSATMSNIPTSIPVWSNNSSANSNTTTNPADIPLPPAPVYDLEDEENLPSPFIKRSLERNSAGPGKGTVSAGRARKSGTGTLLALATANSATASIKAAAVPSGRPSLLSRAVRASDGAKKAMLRRPGLNSATTTSS